MSTEAITLDAIKPIETKLQQLKSRIAALQVVDPQTYSEACQIALDIRGEIKAIGFVLDPGIASAQAHLDTLKIQKANYVNPNKLVLEGVEAKAEAWKAEERRKAKLEQDRINEQARVAAQRKATEERIQAEEKAKEDLARRNREAAEIRKAREKEIEQQRKAGEIGKRESDKLKKQEAAEAEEIKRQAAEDFERARIRAIEDEKLTAANVKTVTVAPAVPKVSGIRARVNYKFVIVDASKVRPEFKIPDEVAIGRKVRNDKNPAKSMAEIGGIQVEEEDSI